MKSIDADIKEGKFKNIYFLMGVEPYLIRLYRDKLVNALVGTDDELNCRYYDGPVSDMGEVLDIALCPEKREYFNIPVDKEDSK